ncbi:glycosyltransferase involved in cell wall biosynthesis [Oceanihabitans sediminis]|uniref:Glycosyltransferase family 1 protein n=1 Tax=Oceanihabitans sediminis TaxID=1812012 RepID=A0A368P713_9FLAO|nr:glycosyltransferase family 4 protein [Oceanihabitans sediminis]RBP34665.1 glycosyltransferase involved in cell wall biosynthesis [Oceanihabitans sediminis]RCU58318.1 glycosyltransferase family 1 protein [Oceanihabitans sediminis]
MSKTILYIHQSAELYGSDKTLLYLANGINIRPDFNVIVVIPNDGPLKKKLEAHHIKVIISPIIKVSRSMFTIKSLLLLPFTIITSVNKLKKALKGTKVDIVHSNTLAVLVGAFYAKKYKIRHIWHVHEIIEKPKIVSSIFPVIVDLFSSEVVFNSNASKTFLCNKRPRLLKKSHIVLNGLDREAPKTSTAKIKNIRTNLFKVEKHDVVLGLVGRINKWKGQLLLLEAFKNVKPEFNNLKLIFIGSPPPNQDYFIHDLQNKIEEYKLENDCRIVPFQNNIWGIWDSIDIAVIPSTEPEPFGLVALEAMLAKKLIIAANHGGLVEIILPETGYLFAPNDVKSLEVKIKQSLTNEGQVENFIQKGYKRAINEFSLQTYLNHFIKLYKISF